MLHLIVNPNTKKSLKALSAAENILKERGAEYDVFRSEKTGDIRREVARLTEEGETTVVAVGGDGTLNEVLSGIVDPARTILGLIPAGTGNDFAAAARIPYGEKAVDLILNSKPKFTDFLDCGQAGRSLNIAGLGIDVDILARRERKKAEGKEMSYFSSLIRSLLSYRPLQMKIIADGVELNCAALLAAACNGTQFGGGIRICPPAAIDDGKMDFLAVDCPRRIFLPYYLIKLMRGKLYKNKICRRILCEEVRIFPDGTDNVQLDGEIVGAKELVVRVVTQKLRMYRGEYGQSV